ncbi:Kelch-type beta propeller [Corchorus capsularis]|uniref:Kelch-type beta propeller n=1 Tax=Corchorus capsularis TaxID=210143 RepID=A0A1R3H668_COCAP|nr:Kelch-type beta propeller [Corchorus capsularis]
MMDRSNSVSPPAKKQKNLVPCSSRVRDVLIRASNWEDGEFVFDWYILNLEDGTIRSTLMRMPPEARGSSTAVACSNQIYVLGGVCSRDGTCPDGESYHHFHDSVLYFDGNDPEKGWSPGKLMSLARARPSAVSFDSKIYAFGGYREGPLAEYLDINDPEKRWYPVLAPSPLFDGDMSYPVVLDSARRRILVHFMSNDSLYAYYVDDNRWCLLKKDFGGWTRSMSAVIVGNVLYTLSTYGELDFFFFPEHDKRSLTADEPTSSLRAYDLGENKALPTRWLSGGFKGYAPVTSDLVHIGSNNLCLVWLSGVHNTLEYIKFSVTRDSSGEVHATSESESEARFPIKANVFQISLLLIQG